MRRTIILAIILSLLIISSALAHEGEDHANETAEAEHAKETEEWTLGHKLDKYGGGFIFFIVEIGLLLLIIGGLIAVEVKYLKENKKIPLYLILFTIGALVLLIISIISFI